MKLTSSPTLSIIAVVLAAVMTAACQSGTPAVPLRADSAPAGQQIPPAGQANAPADNVPQGASDSMAADSQPVSLQEQPQAVSGTARAINWTDNVTVTIDAAAGTMTIASDGLPDHATGDWSMLANPRAVIAQNLSYTLPLDPQIAPSTSDVPMGPIGIMINGVVFFNAYNAQRQDAVIAEANDFDDCLGHPDPMRGIYHYHQSPVCIIDDDPGQHSYLIGFAFDGFPVYGPQGDDGTPPTDLDECNGHTGAIPEYPDGTYHYHVTSTFPYILGCYHGTSTVAGPGRQ